MKVVIFVVVLFGAVCAIVPPEVAPAPEAPSTAAAVTVAPAPVAAAPDAPALPASNATEEPLCPAPNGGGFQPVLSEFTALIPSADIYKRIIMALSVDSETQQVMSYISSPKFHDLVRQIQATPEFIDLMTYTCNELYLDAAYYFNFLSSLFGLPATPRVQSRASPGFRGLFLDILDLVPTEILRARLEAKMATDPYIQVAAEKMKSPEFATLTQNLHNSTGYIEMLTGLRDLGVDVDIVLDTINRTFLY